MKFTLFLGATSLLFSFWAHAQGFDIREKRPAFEVGVTLTNVKTDDIPSVDSNDTLLKAFKYVRDLRFLKDPENPENLRRIPWLYVSNGCDTRAYQAAKLLAGIGIKSMKVFAFGNLQMKTNLEKLGRGEWEYHVANIVMVAGVPMVIDPSVNMFEPLPLTAWIGSMADPHNVKIAICDTNAYTRRNLCVGDLAMDPDVASKDQDALLIEERIRVIDLYQDPKKWLGDEPPWKTQ